MRGGRVAFLAFEVAVGRHVRPGIAWAVGHGGVPRGDQRRSRPRVRLAGQLSPRRVDGGRIAHVREPVRLRQPRRPEKGMQPVRVGLRPGPVIRPLEVVERADGRRPSAARPGRDHGRVAIPRLERLHHPRAVLRQVIAAQRSAVGDAVVRYGLGEVSLIEGVRTLPGHGVQTVGKLRLHQPRRLAHLGARRPAVGVVDAPKLRVAARGGGVAAHLQQIEPRQPRPASRQLHRRLNQRAPRQPAVPLVEQRQAGDGAGNRHRRPADQVCVVHHAGPEKAADRLPAVQRIPVGRCQRRGLHGKGNHVGSGGSGHDGISAAADAARPRLGHANREGCRNRRVHRIPTGPQRFQADAAGLGVFGGGHTPTPARL